ncbi:hypothetical protein [Bacillus sp. FJAT-45037]|uniref:hypothetical protein n=1 Tax=Bacillus sp. FJAT-45037 TaxID=2011007 RepID=UPI001E31D080|nr:hypothetical protein [Bacillus sp. FJAT-45037]
MFYGITTIVYFLWLFASLWFPEPSWWSIFSSNRSTHTPLFEQVSIVKVAISVFVFVAISFVNKRYKN